ncbi:HIR complex subunit [Coemansia biformis]|uniref:HIR complex subunit n=1 Tax=Coemansia biformis TaxID=1286918 RepID=A0A9W7Y7T9_9FUNG|nr:HIR complex subunit [Coemansia biformis]
MRISKPEWLHHDGDKNKLTAIFSLDFDPSGARLATAGMDNKVRLWNTRAVTHSNAGEPQLLSTLSAHSGAVMCVRFSHGSGRYLASGADDMVVLIWERDTADNAAIGSNIAGAGNVETWRPMRRLTGHESDFVKGLTFDPAGKYLATQSDDKTLRIWRTSDWQLQATVSKPFQDNIFSTYFRRPSWSPDGDCIATANAANGKVPVAAVVTRDKWTADLSFVGHHAAIEAVRFCPRVFRLPAAATAAAAADAAGSDGQSAAVSICAAGAQDRSVTVWLTSQPVPLVVAPNLFSANLLDLAWHVPEPAAGDQGDPTVALLAACSHDGTVALVEFRRSELGAPVSPVEQEDMLVRHGWMRSSHTPGRHLTGLAYIYESDGEDAGGTGSGMSITHKPQPIAESITQLKLEELNAANTSVPRETRIAQIVDNLVAQPQKAPDQAPLTAEARSDSMAIDQEVQPAREAEAMPVPVRTKNGRRRVAPLFVRPLGGQTPSASTPAARTPAAAHM